MQDPAPNPYAPPQQPSEFQLPEFEYFVLDGFLVVRDGSVLPDRCVLSNKPTKEEDRITKKIQGHRSFRLVLEGDYFRLTYSIHRSERRKSMAIRVGIGAVLTATLFFSAAMPGAFFYTIPAIIISLFGSPNVFAVKKAHDGHYWLKGCCPAFIDSIIAEQASGDIFAGQPSSIPRTNLVRDDH